MPQNEQELASSCAPAAPLQVIGSGTSATTGRSPRAKSRRRPPETQQDHRLRARRPRGDGPGGREAVGAPGGAREAQPVAAARSAVRGGDHAAACILASTASGPDGATATEIDHLLSRSMRADARHNTLRRRVVKTSPVDAPQALTVGARSLASSPEASFKLRPRPELTTRLRLPLRGSWRRPMRSASALRLSCGPSPSRRSTAGSSTSSTLGAGDRSASRDPPRDRPPLPRAARHGRRSSGYMEGERPSRGGTAAEAPRRLKTTSAFDRRQAARSAPAAAAASPLDSSAGTGDRTERTSSPRPTSTSASAAWPTGGLARRYVVTESAPVGLPNRGQARLGPGRRAAHERAPLAARPEEAPQPGRVTV